MIDTDPEKARRELLNSFTIQLHKFEGSVPWMYLDTGGVVTVGVGCQLSTPSSARGLPFLDPSGIPANAGEILRNYEQVLKMEPGMKPEFYRTPSSVLLAETTISSLLMRRVKECDADLGSSYSFGYGSAPQPAKLALLDMLFTLGPHGLFRGFPELMTDVQHTDWAAAALHCHRKGVSKERNAWTAAQFKAAASLQRRNGPELGDGWDWEWSKPEWNLSRQQHLK